MRFILLTTTRDDSLPPLASPPIRLPGRKARRIMRFVLAIGYSQRAMTGLILIARTVGIRQAKTAASVSAAITNAMVAGS